MILLVHSKHTFVNATNKLILFLPCITVLWEHDQ